MRGNLPRLWSRRGRYVSARQRYFGRRFRKNLMQKSRRNRRTQNGPPSVLVHLQTVECRLHVRIIPLATGFRRMKHGEKHAKLFRDGVSVIRIVSQRLGAKMQRPWPQRQVQRVVTGRDYDVGRFGKYVAPPAELRRGRLNVRDDPNRAGELHALVIAPEQSRTPEWGRQPP